jgi:hypothetical protein
MVLIQEHVGPICDARNTLNARRHGQDDRREEAAHDYHAHRGRHYDIPEDQSPSPAPLGPCRQNLVGSPPRGMPKVVDYRQTGVQATNEMVMQNNTRVYLGSGHRVGVIPYVLLYFVIAVSNNVLQARLA